ncbi:DUF302 domain-containing protein [Mycobacterium mantenii]|uniref:ABC transporter n=1 Tax=Mycobacterium mantenii TaxID=560555 RepID=A0A1A2TMM5_MYCNT|nr:DUF302 domain-containing protein [Mycobacterium mantenii]OBH49880.1 ABC transporter [Mycobacterium mantenii]OBH50850.1 ABC transporter [Mycobacterium mantenii]OBH65601.1 ABC transporter [Mycobacterium mantenii]OBH77615.1 ABC transporter [Mycobacterium mantenii]
MTIALSTRLASRFQDAVDCTREALAQNGFGVLTEIRIAETLKATLGVAIEEYLILGACNLELTYQAISVDRDIGLLLPCNVVVRADPGDPDTVIVEAMDPTLLVEVIGEPALLAIAREIAEKLSAAIASLTAVHS